MTVRWPTVRPARRPELLPSFHAQEPGRLPREADERRGKRNRNPETCCVGELERSEREYLNTFTFTLPPRV